MRGGNVLGRFDPEYEIKSIRAGISQDLQRPVGQSVRWRLYDDTATEVDDVYDIGSRAAGRSWKAPITLPVINAYVFQNEQYFNDRGLYMVDTLRLYVNYDDVIRHLPTLDASPDVHIKDRVEFRDQTYVPNRIFPRGQVTWDYMALMVDLTQVKPEEMINDIYQ